jgi:hypothetical protein
VILIVSPDRRQMVPIDDLVGVRVTHRGAEDSDTHTLDMMVRSASSYTERCFASGTAEQLTAMLDNLLRDVHGMARDHYRVIWMS